MFYGERKYRNKKTEVDGYTFDSKKEAARYVELKYLETEGVITGLTLQPKYHCTVNNKKVCTYVADFEYTTTADMKMHVEDVKGFKTDVYKLKKKLVEALYNLTIEEI